ncbi:MAG TPA: oligosaccharide flippase family protein, partial [Casimicrobiaceae bacterium]
MRRRARLLPAALVHGIGYLAGGEAINLLLSLVSFVVVARLLTTADYGSWATILDGVSILAAIAAFGLPLAAVQAVAGPDGDRFVAPALLLRIASNGLIALVVLMAIAVSPERSTFGLAALFAAPGMIASGLGAACEEILRARQQFRRAATLENLARATQVAAIAVIAAVYKTGSIPRPGAASLVAAWSAAWAIGAAVGITWVRPSRPSGTDALLRRLHQLGRATPALGVVTFVTLMRFRVEVVLLGVLRTSAEAGQFAVATRLYTVALVIPRVVIAALFPYLLHARQRDTADLRGHVGRLFLLVLGCGVLVDGVMVVMAPVAVRLTAGSAYSGSSVPARVLAGFIAPAYLSSVLTILLVEGQRPRAAAAALLGPAACAYVVELALVGRFGQDVCLAAGGGALLVSCAVEFL